MLSLLQATGLAAAGALEGEWVSYRDAYRAMVAFEKYGGAKNLILNELQVLPKEHGSGDALQLTVSGKNTHLALPLDATGRTVFPLLKSAYDDNAVLALNQKDAQFALRPRVTISVRTNGIYDSVELRAACEQALGFARYVDASARSRQCVGVRFVFDKKAGTALVGLRTADGTTSALPVADSQAFDAGNPLPTVTFRFSGVDHAQLLTTTAPLAIAPLFE
ncbi:MAG: hypothetical protein ACXWC4_04200 [Telluria sp.]